MDDQGRTKGGDLREEEVKRIKEDKHWTPNEKVTREPMHEEEQEAKEVR